MNSKRPYKLMMVISLGCMALGCAVWLFDFPQTKDLSDFQGWILSASSLLVFFGVTGFIMSLVWLIATDIISRYRSHHPKS